MESLINFLNEVGMLAKTPRSGYAFLGSGKQSVAEHSHRMALVAYALASMSQEKIDLQKLLLMCLLHDLPEARTGDLNYVNKRYVKDDELKVVEELKDQSPLGPQIASLINEYIDNTSIEARLAHDADKLEMLLVLKELHDTGNPRAMEWFDTLIPRLQTHSARLLAETIRTTPSDGWWKSK